MSPDVIVTDSAQFIPDATLYDFGILISSVHMAWVRAVCGRLEMRYRYSAKIVYNNFPWPELTEDVRGKIEKTAQGILDARNNYLNDSLADLYAEPMTAYDLKAAHEANDAAVMEAYGFKKGMSESEVVAKLFELYAKLTGQIEDFAKEKSTLEHSRVATQQVLISLADLKPEDRPVSSGQFHQVQEMMRSEFANLKAQVTSVQTSVANVSTEMQTVRTNVDKAATTIESVHTVVGTVKEHAEKLVAHAEGGKKSIPPQEAQPQQPSTAQGAQHEQKSKPPVKPRRSKQHYEIAVDVAAAAMGMSKRELERILAGEIRPPDGFPGLDSRIRFELWVPGYRASKLGLITAKKMAKGSGKPPPEKPGRA